MIKWAERHYHTSLFSDEYYIQIVKIYVEFLHFIGSRVWDMRGSVGVNDYTERNTIQETRWNNQLFRVRIYFLFLFTIFDVVTADVEVWCTADVGVWCSADGAVWWTADGAVWWSADVAVWCSADVAVWCSADVGFWCIVDVGVWCDVDFGTV